MEKNRLRKYFFNSSLLIESVFFAFLISEIFVRIFIPQDKKVIWIEMHEEGFMMNQESGSAIHELNDRKTTYQFTEYRTRGNELPDQNKRRILTLGDSFTFGLHLDEVNTYVSLLQQKTEFFLPDSVQFLNAAVGGTGLADWPGWLENFGSALQPDVIILFLNTNDIERSLSKNLFVYDEVSDSLVKSQRWKPRPFFTKLGNKTWYRWLQEHSELMNIIVKILWKFVYFDDLTDSLNQEETKVIIPNEEQFDPESEYSLRLSQKMTERMDDWCTNNDCRFIVATTGFFDQVKPDIYTSGFYEWLNNSESLSYSYYDITPCILDKSGKDLESIQISGDSHPDETGASIIADCSWNWLEDELINKPAVQN